MCMCGYHLQHLVEVDLLALEGQGDEVQAGVTVLGGREGEERLGCRQMGSTRMGPLQVIIVDRLRKKVRKIDRC